MPRTLEEVDKQTWQGQVAQLTQKLKANPNDETALSQLPGFYYDLARWNDAVDAQKKWLAFVQNEPKHDAAWTAQLNLAYRYLALYQLFIRDFAGSLASNDEARKLDSSALGMELTRAEALVFLGHTSEAEVIFLGHRGEKMIPSDPNSSTWENQVNLNFDALQKAGIITPDMAPEIAHIRELLKTPAK